MRWCFVVGAMLSAAVAGCSGGGSGAGAGAGASTSAIAQPSSSQSETTVSNPTPAVTSISTSTSTATTASPAPAQTSVVATSTTLLNTSPAPQISGTPLKSVVEGNRYEFQPSVSGTGTGAVFVILHCPSWATFDSNTGELSGTPDSSDVGTYSQIRISVEEGSARADLTPFSIVVAQTASGSAEMSWVAPTQNTDGTTLTDLAGYKIHYGTNSSSLAATIDVADPSASSYRIDNLTTGTWYFIIKAYASSGLESDASKSASKVILD